MTFWWRWNYNYPSIIYPVDTRGNWLSIAFASETGSCDANMKDRLFGLWRHPNALKYHVTTYATNKGDAN